MRRWKLLCLLLIVLAFIWGNSLMPASASAALSGWLHDLLSAIFPGGASAQQGDGLLRKLAHFTEFAVLGCLLCWALYLPGAKRRSFALPSLAIGFAVACVDEGIQFFSPGRGPSLRDVGIDSAGVLLGIGLFLLGYSIRKLKTNE